MFGMTGTSHARKRRFELAFGINQEVPRGDNLFPASQTAQHDGAVIDLVSQLDLSRFKIAVIEGHENDLLGAGIEHGASRDRKLPSIVNLQRDVGPHVRFQFESRIGEIAGGP